MKRVIALLTAAVLLLPLFAVNVSAAGTQYFYQDFEGVAATDTKGGFQGGTTNDNSRKRQIVDDPKKAGNKVVKFENRMSGVNIIDSYLYASGAVRGECIFTFDYMQLSTKASTLDVKYVSIELNGGGTAGNRPRMGLMMMNYADGYRLTPQNDEWYSFLVHINSDFSSAAVYRKKRDANEPYVFVKNEARANLTGNERACFRTYCGQVDYMLDNIGFYQGSFGSGGYFTMDGSKLTALGDVTDGTLKATAVYTSGAVKTQTSEGKTVLVESSTVFPFAVVYDATGKMIDCTPATSVSITAGRHELSTDIDTAGFYDKLSGGYIGYYVWKDFTTAEPLTDAVELK